MLGGLGDGKLGSLSQHCNCFNHGPWVPSLYFLATYVVLCQYYNFILIFGFFVNLGKVKTEIQEINNAMLSEVHLSKIIYVPPQDQVAEASLLPPPDIRAVSFSSECRPRELIDVDLLTRQHYLTSPAISGDSRIKVSLKSHDQTGVYSTLD